ncbi:4-hydroxyphenylacetate 3-hydroxylase C-terminal domain-containing protein [Paenibacillus sp. FSL K6-1217]|uniref:4-hydroxyphenylacetate 3-hydroxylase C-terminal domain-containing protein n=1 Tax=Paenibacillus sp. FSL K6-1217 TaxID=2921466 RepID=UPI0038649D98
MRLYVKGQDTSTRDRIALFRLTWELAIGPFGGRQKQFERFSSETPVRLLPGCITCTDLINTRR